MNEPKLRFPEFTDDWNQCKLGDVCKTNGRIGFRGYTEKDIISKDAGGVLTFSPTNIVDNQLTIKVKNTYIKREKYEESPEIMVKNGNILFVKTGSTLGKSALVSEIEEDCTVNPQVVVIKADIELQKILSVVLISASVQKQIAAVKIGGAVPTMTETELKNIDLVLPQNDEEKIKLGECFSNLDNLIQSAEKELEGYRELKRGMLQKMFPKKGETVPEIRFPEFSGDWKKHKLGDLAKIVGGGTPSTSNTDFWDGEINWFAPAEIANQVYVSSSERKITKLGYNSSSARMLPIGTVLFTSRAGIGKTAILSEEACTNQGFQSIVPDGSKLDSYFIFARSAELKRYGETVGAGSTFVEVSGKQMAAMPLMMPPTLDEQKKIGEYFQNLDNLIASQQQELEGYKELKKGLLQQMFC